MKSFNEKAKTFCRKKIFNNWLRPSPSSSDFLIVNNKIKETKEKLQAAVMFLGHKKK
jgi:hypothetical protein